MQIYQNQEIVFILGFNHNVWENKGVNNIANLSTQNSITNYDIYERQNYCYMKYRIDGVISKLCFKKGREVIDLISKFQLH